MKTVFFTFIFIFGLSLSSAKTKKPVNHGESAFVKTCSSESRRTHLTLFYESQNETRRLAKIVFAIDGRHVTYDPNLRSNPATGEDEQVCEGECIVIQTNDNGSTHVRKGNKNLLSLSFQTIANKIIIHPGFKSPLPWKSNGSEQISLRCKEFPPQTH